MFSFWDDDKDRYSFSKKIRKNSDPRVPPRESRPKHEINTVSREEKNKNRLRDSRDLRNHSRDRSRDRSRIDHTSSSTKQTKVAVVESRKKIGETTVFQKPGERGFWTEKPTEKGSDLSLKRENFQTRESDDIIEEPFDFAEYADGLEKLSAFSDRLSDQIEKHGSDFNFLVAKVNKLETEFRQHQANTNEILNLIKTALKIKVEEIKEPPKKRENFDIYALENQVLSYWGEHLFPFGDRRIHWNGVAKELAFGFRCRDEDYFAYGCFHREDETQRTYIEIKELNEENGDKISPDEIEFPINLEFIPFDTVEELSAYVDTIVSGESIESDSVEFLQVEQEEDYKIDYSSSEEEANSLEIEGVSIKPPEEAPVEQGEQPEEAPVEQGEQPEEAPVEQGEQPEGAPVEQPEEAPVEQSVEQGEQPEEAPVEQSVEQGEQPEEAPVEQSVEQGEQPEEAPVEQPEEAPVEAPVEQPEEAPVEAPVEQPEEAPVEQPEEAPVEQPEEAPVEQPEEAPVEQPEEAPVEQPEEPEGAPVEQPEEAPVEQSVEQGEQPEEAPVEQPEKAPVEQPEEAPVEVPEEIPLRIFKPTKLTLRKPLTKIV